MDEIKIKLIVNGIEYKLNVLPSETLLETVRDKLHLTGAKYVCGIGECGACTVLVEGKPKLSCLTLAASVDGKSIMTIEGLSKGGFLHPLQRAFIEGGAIQCGYCTPGMILTAKALLDENPKPTEADVKEAIKGNLCRCTGYVKIIEAILKVGRGQKR